MFYPRAGVQDFKDTAACSLAASTLWILIPYQSRALWCLSSGIQRENWSWWLPWTEGQPTTHCFTITPCLPVCLFAAAACCLFVKQSCLIKRRKMKNSRHMSRVVLGLHYKTADAFHSCRLFYLFNFFRILSGWGWTNRSPWTSRQTRAWGEYFCLVSFLFSIDNRSESMLPWRSLKVNMWPFQGDPGTPGVQGRPGPPGHLVSSLPF